MEAERDVATEQVDTEQKARKSAEQAKVQADKRVHSVHRELNQVAAITTKTNGLIAKAAAEGLKHRADVLWVQGRKEAFVTEDQIYAARSRVNAFSQLRKIRGLAAHPDVALSASLHSLRSSPSFQNTTFCISSAASGRKTLEHILL